MQIVPGGRTISVNASTVNTKMRRILSPFNTLVTKVSPLGASLLRFGVIRCCCDAGAYMPEQRDSTGTLDDYSSPQFAENSEDADSLNAPRQHSQKAKHRSRSCAP